MLPGKDHRAFERGDDGGREGRGHLLGDAVALQAPELVRRMILTGTAPRGGGGIEKIGLIAATAYVKAASTFGDAKNFLFFPRTGEGKRAASNYVRRLGERTSHRDQKISMQARIGQLRAIRRAGLSTHSSHSADLARRLPNSLLKIYPDSGHGGVFQHHETFVPDALAFLAGSPAN